MKNTSYFFILLFLLNNYCFSQKGIPYFDLHKKVHFFINLEEKLGSKKFDTDTEYISLDNSAQPIIYRRKEKGIPDLLVFYKFSKKDSLVTEILYEWDTNNFEKGDDIKLPLESCKSIVKKYLDLQKNITATYGNATTKGNLENISKVNTQEGLSRKDLWTPNDSLKINMYTDICNYYEKKGMVTTTPTHRIRLYVNYINRNKSESFSIADRLPAAEKNFNSFLTFLKDKNYDKARALLSEKIKAAVNNEILTQISQGIDNNKQLEVYMSGMQIMPQDGKQYLMAQFKYSNDNNTPPQQYIKVIFDADNTLLMIQPMKKN